MKASTRGAHTSQAEVVSIDREGIWLLVDGKEYFLRHEDFPWFRQATLDSILTVELLPDDQLYWPDLDVDLSLDSLACPEPFPRIYK